MQLKGLIAGPVNLALGIRAGGGLPASKIIVAAGLVGFLGYGVSLALFIVCLRHLGTARTSAYFSSAPFLGALAAVVLSREPITAQLMAAGLLMGLGVWLHLTETHEHERMEHAHPDVHDEHHQHEHAPDDPPGEPHTHIHRHERLRHRHPHVPDMHHTHRH